MFLNRICKSFEARIIQPFILCNYEKTRYGKQIQSLKNKYKGKRCFLIGNGPSLKASDLDMLYKHNEITFAFNRIYNIFNDTKWRPTFYISQDEKMLNGCKQNVSELDIRYKFIPIQMKWNYGINIDNALYFNFSSQPVVDDFEFSTNPAKKIYCANTVMYSAVQLAIYMGFKKIIFLGVDHHFKISMNNSGKIVVDNSVEDYFSKEYNSDREKLYIPNTEQSTLTYVAIKKYCELYNVEVNNATRGGKLEVFKRIDIDKLFLESEKNEK